MNKLFLSFYFVTGAIISSCTKYDDVGDDIDKIEISFLQQFKDGRPEPYFLAKGGNYRCNGVPIAYQFDKTEEVLYLNFGSTYGIPCQGSSSSYPAHIYIYPGFLKKGNYLFEISNRGQTLHSILTVGENKYEIANSMGSTVTFSRDPAVIYLTPVDALWGYVRGNASVGEQDFLDSLYALGAVPYAPLLESGDYYYYKIVGGNPEIGYSSGTSFLLKSGIGTDTLEDIFQDFIGNGSISSGSLRTGTGIVIE